MTMELLFNKLEQAQKHKNEFRLAEALALFEECTQIDPKSTQAWAQAGLCALILGDLLKAETCLKNAYETSFKTDVMVGSYLVAVLAADDKRDDARIILEKCMSQDPMFDFAESLMVVSEMLMEKKKYDESLRLIDILSRAFNETDWFKVPRNHYRLIRVLAAAEIFDIAEELANSLVAQTQNGWEGMAALASIAIAKKQYDAAYTYTSAALSKGGTADPLLEAQAHWLSLNK